MLDTCLTGDTVPFTVSPCLTNRYGLTASSQNDRFFLFFGGFLLRKIYMITIHFIWYFVYLIVSRKKCTLSYNNADMKNQGCQMNVLNQGLKHGKHREIKIGGEVKISTAIWLKSKLDTAKCSIFDGEYRQSGNPEKIMMNQS